jgi:hypothetical protein
VTMLLGIRDHRQTNLAGTQRGSQFADRRQVCRPCASSEIGSSA